MALDFGLQGKLVLVTGSTDGIGFAIAEAYAKAGARVVVNGRSQEKAEAAAAKVQAAAKASGLGGQAIAIAGDVGTADGASEFLKAVDAQGEVDVLVNNVGIFGVHVFEEIPDEEWERFFQVNVMSGVRITRHVLPKMLSRDSGCVLFIASEAAVKPLGTMVHYGMTKGAQLTFARGLAETTKGTKVRVNSILPGPTWTTGVESYMKGVAEQEGTDLDTAIANYFVKNEPASLIQRFVQPEEVAATTVFAGSALASATNGHAYRVEGGLYRSI